MAERERSLAGSASGTFQARTRVMSADDVARAVKRMAHEILERNHGAADVMIQCSAEEAADGPAVELECTKMKDDEPFKNIAAVLKRVELPNGRSSLVVSHETDLQSIGGTIAQQQILDILATEFTENGATNKELLAAFIDAKYGSQSTFNRGLKALKEKKELRLEGKRKGARYFLGGAT